MAVLIALPSTYARGQSVAEQSAFDAGLAAFERGAYDAALNAWQSLAEGGMAAAQLGLGVLYFDGLGVNRDDELAAGWFSRAAQAGNVEAQFNYGRMYFAGRGVAQDLREARRWYEQASNSGHGEASYHLGTLYAGGLGGERDDLLAFHRFDLALEQAEDARVRTLAQSNRGLVERRLNGDQIAQAKAMTSVALRAQADAAAAAAGSYEGGLAAFNEQDYDAAIAAWRPAAARGDAHAQLGLAVAYHDGLGVDQDLVVAADWFRRAGEQGLAEAQFNLGVLYYSGRGLTADPAEAARWYVLAGDQGHGEANYYLGTMYVSGLGVARDNVAAYRRFGLAVEQSDGSGETALNRLAVQGRDSVARRLSASEIAVLEGRSADTVVTVEPESAVVAEAPVREPEAVPAARGEVSVGELEAAAGQAREAQATVEALGTRVAELEAAAGENGAGPAEAAAAAAASQLADINGQLAEERASQNQQEALVEQAEKNAEAAARRLRSQRRAVAGIQTQLDAVREELADIEARRQAALQQQDAVATRLASATTETDAQADAVAALQQEEVATKESFEASGQRLLDLSTKRSAAVKLQAAAAQQLEQASRTGEEAERELAAVRQALIQANDAAAAARDQLGAATLAFNRTGEMPAGADAPANPVAAEQKPVESPADAPKELVARVQRSLASLGFEPGQADGVPGKRTLDALRQFQVDNKLPPTGEVTEEIAFILEIMASAQVAPVRPELKLAGSGTGFVIAGDGYVLTNHHVVTGCVEVRVDYNNETYVAPHLASDESNDLALLNTAIQTEDFLAFRAGRAIRPGDDVVVLGFPLQGQLSDQVKVTKGTISALSGPKNNRTLLQTTAPVQAGSSGGPLLDLSGNIVGVVMGKISSVEVENVSFGIKSAIARIFLDAEGVNYRSVPSGTAQAAADVADRARQFTVLVECWNE